MAARTWKWALAGLGAAIFMALWEYAYLAATVPQFATPAELLLFGWGLLSVDALLATTLGALLGASLGLSLRLGREARLWSAALLGRTRPGKGEPRLSADAAPASDATEGEPRPPRRSWLRAAGTALLWLLFGAALVADGLAYHRLYFRYHLALEAAAFLLGLSAVLAAAGLARSRGLRLEVRPSFRLAGLAAAALLVGSAPLAAWHVASRENLRYVIQDRGLVSQKLLAAARRFADRDGDGFAARPLGYDCDDSNPERHPLAWDEPGDGRDEDCSGADRSKPRPWPSPPSPVPSRPPRRILLVTADAVRYDAFATLLARGELPTLARLAEAGFLFTRAHAAGSWTVPSVHALLTGRYPCHFRWGIATVTVEDRVLVLDPRAPFVRNPANRKKLIPAPVFDHTPTLAELLRARGYRTATVQDTLFLKRELGLARGFEIVVDRPYRQANMDLRGITAPLMVREALNVIQNHRREKLFFYMHISDPHAPYRVHPGIPVARDMKSRYLGEIRFVDLWLGRLLAGLQREGLLEDTLFVFASDHGEEFRDHGGLFHGTTLYQEILHVPLLFVGSGIRPGRSDALVSLVDVVPTILGLVDRRCGLVSGPGLDLCPLVTRGRTSPGLHDRMAYARLNRFENHLEAVLWQHFKLVRDHSAGAEALFDLERDPGETVNVSGLHPRVRRRLERGLSQILDGP